jgi:hypothetical protein
MSFIHPLKGTETWPMMVSGSARTITPSLTSTHIDSPQSRQGVSMRTVFPGYSQLTASDSKAHCPNPFGSPSTLILNWVGWLLNGANEAMKSVPG